MALPAIARLRECMPDARFTLITASKLAGLFHQQPGIDKVITFERDQSVLAVARRIRAEQFDLSLILPNSFRSALESWLARVPVRAGYSGNGRAVLLTRAVAKPAVAVHMRKKSDAEVRAVLRTHPNRPRETFPTTAHHLHHYLHLVAQLGANPEPMPPRINVSEEERAAVRARFKLPAGQKFFGLNPGAEYGPAKRWPVEKFIAAAREVSQRKEVRWLIFGGPNDQAAAASISAALPESINLAGKTSLRELCAAFSLCEAVLTNDTGPMHLAAAVGARVVVPFGSTSPELTGPGLPGSSPHALTLGQAPCAPCFRRTCPIDFRCMLSIQPSTVAARLLELK